MGSSLAMKIRRDIFSGFKNTSFFKIVCDLVNSDIVFPIETAIFMGSSHNDL